MADVNSIVAVGAPVLGLVGVVVGAAITISRDEKKRRLDWLEKQLREFYAPLWGIRLEIQSLSNYRLKVEEASIAEANKVMQRTEGMDPAALGKLSQKVTDTFNVDVPYNNKQLKEVLLPAYREMQRLFKDRMHLADSETMAFFPILVMFNETWNRAEAVDVPLQVALRVSTREKELHPFYEHLEAKSRDLKSAIKSGKLPKAGGSLLAS